MKHKKQTVSLLILLTSIILTALLSSGTVDTSIVFKTPTPTISSASPSATLNVPVLYVVDGDTIAVSIDGKKENVRFIGIDTPETKDPRKLVQCFGREAAEETKRMLTGQTVILLSDPTQGDRDKYKRLLRYIILPDGTNVNAHLIAEGYAHEYTYGIPYLFQDDFKHAQRKAREEKKGLWNETVCPIN